MFFGLFMCHSKYKYFTRTSVSLIIFAKDGKYPLLVHKLADYQILNIFLVAGNVNDSKLVLIYSILKGFC